MIGWSGAKVNCGWKRIAAAAAGGSGRGGRGRRHVSLLHHCQPPDPHGPIHARWRPPRFH